MPMVGMCPGHLGSADVDALAIDPLDGQMYGVINDDGRKDHLVRIDKATGQPTDIGVLGAQDVEGLGFASGQLIGTTGKVFESEGIWDIDKTTGAASNRRVLDNSRDYESFDCLNAPNPPAAVPPPPPPPVAGETITQPPLTAPAPAAPIALAELPRTGPSDGTPRRLAISGFLFTLGASSSWAALTDATQFAEQGARLRPSKRDPSSRGPGPPNVPPGAK
jgi:hypothetical protein